MENALKSFIFSIVRANLLLAALTTTALSATYVIPIPDRASRGWINGSGLRYGTENAQMDGVNNSYYVGGNGQLEYRNFFIFPLPLLAPGEIITAAELLLYCKASGDGYRSSNGSESLAMFAIERTPFALLRAGGSALTGAFQDLGDGTAYNAGTIFTAGSQGSDVSIRLNPAFLSYAQSNAGSEIALGGALVTGGLSPRGYLFAYSAVDYGVGLAKTRLVFTTVPEPSPLIMLALAGALLLAQRARSCPKTRPGSVDVRGSAQETEFKARQEVGSGE